MVCFLYHLFILLTENLHCDTISNNKTEIVSQHKLKFLNLRIYKLKLILIFYCNHLGYEGLVVDVSSYVATVRTYLLMCSSAGTSGRTSIR